MKHKTKARLKFGVADIVRFSLGACILVVFTVGAVISVAAPRDEIISAVGLMVCGKPVGVVMVERSGAHEFMEVTDPRVLETLKKLPEDHKGVLKAAGPYCFPPKPQVY